MSLLTKRVFSKIWLKNIQKYSEFNLIQAQYYSCLGSTPTFKFQEFRHQQSSSLNTVRALNFDLRKANNLLSKTLDKIFFSRKAKEKYVGLLWYQTLDEIKVEEFFTLLQMPDNYFSWFKVTELHVWMLLFQLNQDKATNLKNVRDGIVEAMWKDMEVRAKMIHKYNKNFYKNFVQLYQRFKQQTLFWYDHGYLEDDVVLTNMVWAVFFDRKLDDPEKLEAVVRYIRYQMKHLESIEITSLDESQKTGVWTPLKPHCKSFVT